MLLQNFFSITSILLYGLLLEMVLSMSRKEIQAILFIHNKFRQRMAKTNPAFKIANMQKMKWDSAQQSTAEKHLSYGQDTAKHFNTGTLKGRFQVLSKADIREIIETWYRQGEKFNFQDKRCLSDCPQFANLVYPLMNTVGCEKKSNEDDSDPSVILGCSYGTNQFVLYKDKFEFEYGEPCSQCPEPNNFCDRNLCSRCNAISRKRNCY
ncbi:uncharacterized protein LOC131933294 [Physella acuta]|uniref:uncharacterized protein LOC131933294 n=1 Tax=Physella acuta TaxID=109671 RepID=UPI0027DCA9D7|nr:uncharacterized protein LOC131933294 [Physella acuta]